MGTVRYPSPSLRNVSAHVSVVVAGLMGGRLSAYLDTGGNVFFITLLKCKA